MPSLRVRRAALAIAVFLLRPTGRSPALDTVVVPIETTALGLRDDAGPPIDATVRRFTFKARTARALTGGQIVPPPRGSDGDPRAEGTGAGGEMMVYNGAGGADGVVVALPAAGWMPIGSAENPRGYRYRAANPDDPIQRVEVKGNLIRVKGGGANWQYSLDEMSQGRVAVRLRLGTGFVGRHTP